MEEEKREALRTLELRWYVLGVAIGLWVLSWIFGTETGALISIAGAIIYGMMEISAAIRSRK